MRAVFTCLLDQVSWLKICIAFCLSFGGGNTLIFLLQVSQYITEGLERARDSLTEAAALRERFVLGTSVSRRVAAAAASAVTTIHMLLHAF